MKTLIIALFLFATPVLACEKGTGSGFGYLVDFGGSTFSQASPDYNQSIGSITQNGFIRFHNESGHNAVQFMVGYKKESIFFQNYSDFLSPDGSEMLEFNTDALLKREAWKFSFINQMQFGQKPGKLMCSVNTGLFYEHTVKASRNGNNGDWSYDLKNEIIPNNLGCILGAEIRFGWFTLGYKVEKLFWDVLDHDYILGQELNLSNSSELRGLKLNPWMNYIYLGFNIDFFSGRE